MSQLGSVGRAKIVLWSSADEPMYQQALAGRGYQVTAGLTASRSPSELERRFSAELGDDLVDQLLCVFSRLGLRPGAIERDAEFLA